MKPATLAISLKQALNVYNVLSVAPRSKRSISQKLAIESVLERIRDVGRFDSKKRVFACASSEAYALRYPMFEALPDGKWHAHPKAGQAVLEDDGDTPKMGWQHKEAALDDAFPSLTITEREQQAVVLVLADLLGDSGITNEAITDVMRCAQWLGLHERLDKMSCELDPKDAASAGDAA